MLPVNVIVNGELNPIGSIVPILLSENNPLLPEEDELLEEDEDEDPLEELLDELEEDVVVPQRGAAEPDGAQIISTPLLSFRSLKQSAAVPPLVLEPMHFIQGLFAGQVAIRPFVQYGCPVPLQKP